MRSIVDGMYMTGARWKQSRMLLGLDCPYSERRERGLTAGTRAENWRGMPWRPTFKHKMREPNNPKRNTTMCETIAVGLCF